MLISAAHGRFAGFSDAKAAEVAAYFAARAGQAIDKLKLIKLIYLADRLAMDELGRPILNDEHFSLKDGPICSLSLDGLNGQRESSVWKTHLTRNAHRISSVRTTADLEFDEVSARELRVLDSVWDFFGRMSTSEVRQWTHDHCPEYEEVMTGRRPIEYRRIFEAVGSEDPAARASAVVESRRFAAVTSG